jgi:hypothetical protein
VSPLNRSAHLIALLRERGSGRSGSSDEFAPKNCGSRAATLASGHPGMRELSTCPHGIRSGGWLNGIGFVQPARY